MLAVIVCDDTVANNPPAARHDAMAPKGYRRRDDESVDSGSGPSRKRGAPDGAFYDNSSAKRSKRDEFGGATLREEYTTKVDFTFLPDDALREYMDKHDLVPLIFPSPSSSLTPPPPKDLMNPPPMIPRRELSRTPSPLGLSTGGIPPAGRRRGDNRTSRDRRRSSRLLEEENGWKDMRKPILSDREEAHRAMAIVCQRHYEREVLRENDAVTAFLFAVRNQGDGDSSSSYSLTS